jgi:hypothetical protein
MFSPTVKIAITTKINKLAVHIFPITVIFLRKLFIELGNKIFLLCGLLILLGGSSAGVSSALFLDARCFRALAIDICFVVG